MHQQSTTTLAALLLLLSPTTFAAALRQSRAVETGTKPICKSAAIDVAAHREPDCTMAGCTADGIVLLQGAPDQCMKVCECPPSSPSMAPVATPGTGPAPIVEGNPLGTTYVATLQENEKSGIQGTVYGSSSLDGKGVNFKIALSGFPDASLGPFAYHIHDQPVPADGNCTGTKAHLDPFKRGQMPPCDPKQMETCEVGDLSGKHGKIMIPMKEGIPMKESNTTTNSFEARYTDLFLSTMEGPASFFGNRSIVIHQKDTTRLNCANFTLAPVS